MGAVNDEVELTLAGGAKLVAIVTHSSQQALGLAKGKEAIALIKAPWVTLATEDCGLKFSARNQFAGSVSTITEGAVNATVHIKTDAGFEIVAVVTNESQDEMKLTTGSRVIALIKASAILIGVEFYSYSYKEIARRSHTAVECHLSQCSRRCVRHPRSKKVAQITICHLYPRLD